ncbi:MAG: hypothetical protein WA705_20145 [Candidatus Ozemobacteraceae bacterium]
MTDPSHSLNDALGAYLASPVPATVDRLLGAAGTFVIGHARAWKTSGLAFADRCREILTEMFLILREDIKPGRLCHNFGLLAYLSLRLRRLTRPYRGKSIPFGLSEDLPDVGRLSFTSERLYLVDELVETVRKALAIESHELTQRFEFLFLHVAPDVAGVSRLLAQRDAEDAARRVEADKKRHQAFNRSLRARFEELKRGDWQDISDWSSGERSHLAWRIISFSPIEAAEMGETVYHGLETWRDAAEPFASDFPDLHLSGITCLKRLYSCISPELLRLHSTISPTLTPASPIISPTTLSATPDDDKNRLDTAATTNFSKNRRNTAVTMNSPQSCRVAEDAAVWDEPPEEDLLAQLVSPSSKRRLTSEGARTTLVSEAAPGDAWGCSDSYGNSSPRRSSPKTAIDGTKFPGGLSSSLSSPFAYAARDTKNGKGSDDGADDANGADDVFRQLYAEAAHGVFQWWNSLDVTNRQGDLR